MGSNALIQAYLHNDNEGRKIVTTDKKLLVGAKEEDWEQITLVIPISDIKAWAAVY